MATEQDLAVGMSDDEQNVVISDVEKNVVGISDDEQNVAGISDDENLRGEPSQKRKKEEKKSRTIVEQIQYEEEKQREFFQLINDEVKRQRTISPALNAQAKSRRPPREKAVQKEIGIRRQFIKKVNYEIERQRRVPQVIFEKVEKRRGQKHKAEKNCELQSKSDLKLIRNEAKRKTLQIDINEERELRRQRDSKMLFIKGLPNDTTVEILKSLSNDIVDVSIPNGNSENPSKSLSAVISFNTEAEAESNFKALQSKKLGGQPLILDFYGTKSTNLKVSEKANLGLGLKTLSISGIPKECTIDQIAKYFKTAKQIIFNESPGVSTAKISFRNKKDAQDAYEAHKELEISGKRLTVLFSTIQNIVQLKKRINKARRNKQRKKEGNHAKKLKFSEQSVDCEQY